MPLPSRRLTVIGRKPLRVRSGPLSDFARRARAGAASGGDRVLHRPGVSMSAALCAVGAVLLALAVPAASPRQCPLADPAGFLVSLAPPMDLPPALDPVAVQPPEEPSPEPMPQPPIDPPALMPAPPPLPEVSDPAPNALAALPAGEMEAPLSDPATNLCAAAPSPPAAAAVPSAPPARPGMPSGEEGEGDAALVSYWDRVRDRVMARLSYPAAARNRRSQGVVAVRLELDASGGLVALRPEREADDPALTQAALRAVRRAAPFGGVCASGRLASGVVVSVLPIRFELVEVKRAGQRQQRKQREEEPDEGE